MRGAFAPTRMGGVDYAGDWNKDWISVDIMSVFRLRLARMRQRILHDRSPRPSGSRSYSIARWALLVMLAVAVPVSASASTQTGVTITMVVPNNAGVLKFFVNSARSNAPSCATTEPTAWQIDVTTAAGQSMAAALYLAMASNLPVDIGGIGTCTLQATVETVGYLAVHR